MSTAQTCKDYVDDMTTTTINKNWQWQPTITRKSSNHEWPNKTKSKKRSSNI